MKLAEVLDRLDAYGGDLTIYVDQPREQWSSNMETTLLRESEEHAGRPPTHLTYFLEVSVAKEVLEGWRRSRTRPVSGDEAADVILHYARFDALPQMEP